MGSNTNIKRFRPRVTVEAIQYDGTNATELIEWAGDWIIHTIPDDTDLWLSVPPVGIDRVVVGDWIIRGTTGGFFSRSAEQFAKDYSPEPRTLDLTPEQQIEAATLRLQEANRAAAAAQADMKAAHRAALQAAEELDSLHTAGLSPNAQQFIREARS
jgi:hypothetical protein